MQKSILLICCLIFSININTTQQHAKEIYTHELPTETTNEIKTNNTTISSLNKKNISPIKKNSNNKWEKSIKSSCIKIASFALGTVAFLGGVALFYFTICTHK